MSNDDINWLEASCDFGLVTLCRDMERLAAPVQSLINVHAVRRTEARAGVARRSSLRARRQVLAARL
jgi:hypothetical protein